MYREAFEPLRTLTATKQTLDDDEFTGLFDYDATAVIVSRTRAGEVSGFAVVVNDLKLIPWVNPEFFHERFPEHHATGRLVYIPAFVVAPAHQKGTTFLRLARELTLQFGPSHSILAMDCCLHNAEVVKLPEMLDQVGNRYQRTVTAEIDRQSYWTFDLTDVPDTDAAGTADALD